MKGYEPGDMRAADQLGGQGQGGMQQGGMQGGQMQGGKQRSSMQGGQQMQMGGLDKDGCVLTCTVADCCYNENLECYAQQINVGDDHPMCDTYEPGQRKQPSDHEGFVANCKVTQCHFNDSQQCHARGITVDLHPSAQGSGMHADCGTFRP